MHIRSRRLENAKAVGIFRVVDSGGGNGESDAMGGDERGCLGDKCRRVVGRCLDAPALVQLSQNSGTFGTNGAGSRLGERLACSAMNLGKTRRRRVLIDEDPSAAAHRQGVQVENTAAFARPEDLDAIVCVAAGTVV